MSKHDPLCKHHSTPYVCDCRFIAKVRADEREQIKWEDDNSLRMVMASHDALLAHAEAVAAQLIEVICEQDKDYRVAIEYMWDICDAKDRLLDADQACIAALSAEIDRMVGELSSICEEHEAEVKP